MCILNAFQGLSLNSPFNVPKTKMLIESLHNETHDSRAHKGIPSLKPFGALFLVPYDRPEDKLAGDISGGVRREG